MRKAKCFLYTAMIASLTMMHFPLGIHAEEVGGGETTIHVHVPETHAMQLLIGDHGSLRIEGKTYTNDIKVNVERLSNPRFEIMADNGYEIDTVYYQGENVTGEVNKNTYTAPVLFEDGNVFKVTFKKGSGNSGTSGNNGGGSSSGGGDSSNGSGTTEGSSDSSGSGDSNGGTVDKPSGGGTAGGEDQPSTGGNNSSGSQSGSKEESDKDVVRKDEILDELDKIDEQLKNENLSKEERAELEKKKQELLQEMTDLIVNGKFTKKGDIENNLAYIEKLLARSDLSEEQRQELLKKQEELKQQLEDIENDEKQKTIFAGGLSIIVVVSVSGAAYIFLKKRKVNKQ